MDSLGASTGLSSLTTYALIFICIVILILLIARKNIVLSRWHHTFDTTRFSGQNFFESIEAAIKDKSIPHTNRERIIHKEVILVGANREYLRIRRGSYTFEICTGPFGKGCYVSWWHFESHSYMRRLMLKIPIIRWFLSVKTYHQLDMEKAFEDQLHRCVLESIDAMTGTKGSTLSEAERSLINLPKAILQG